MKKYLNLFILTCSIISIFLVLFKLNYVSLIISTTTLLLSFIFLKKYKRIFLIIIIISISTIITNTIILYKEKQNNIDIFKDTNILLGTWTYNEKGATFNFKNDYSYIKYYNTDTSDNYCIGKYEYTYGGIGNNNLNIKQDNNYYYYTLNLEEEYCIINTNKIIDKYRENLIFGINKSNYNDLIFINKKENYAYKLKKIK